MKTRLILMLLFFINCTHQLYAQNTFYEKGEIVKLDGDTLSGYIERLSEREMSLGINFKNSIESSKIINFSTKDLLGFRFESDKLTFERVEYSFKLEDKEEETALRFAKILLKGYTSLYKIYPQDGEFVQIYVEKAFRSYIVKKGGQYFMLEQQEKIFESLVNRSYRTENYKLDKKYIGQLYYLTSDCGESLSTLKALKFTDNDMIQTLIKYNKCKSPQTTNIEYNYKLKSEKILSFKSGFSGTSNKFVNTRYGFSTGFDFLFYQPGTNVNKAFNIGLEYHFQKLYEANDVAFERHLIKIPVTGVFFLNIGETTNAAVNFGFSANYSLNKLEDSLSRLLNNGTVIFIHQLVGARFNFKKVGLYANIQGNLINLKESDFLFDLGLSYQLFNFTKNDKIL